MAYEFSANITGELRRVGDFLEERGLLTFTPERSRHSLWTRSPSTSRESQATTNCAGIARDASARVSTVMIIELRRAALMGGPYRASIAAMTRSSASSST